MDIIVGHIKNKNIMRKRWKNIFKNADYQGSSGYIITMMLPDIQNAPTFFEKILERIFEMDFISNIFSKNPKIRPRNR